MSAEPPTSSPPPGAKPLWGSTEGGAAPAAPAGTAAVPQSSRYARGSRQSLFGDGPLEPLSVRLLQAAGVLSLLLILVVVNSLLNHSGGESPFDPNPVAAAAERTQAVPGMRFEMTMHVTSGASGSVTITGNGSYNGGTNLAEVAYDATTPKGHVNFDAILGESAWYFRYPQFGATLPEGKEWVKLEGLQGQSEKDTMGVESPDEMLETVGAAGSVHKGGHLRVRGKLTRRYRMVLSPEEVIEVLRSEGKTETAEQLENATVQLVGPAQTEAFIDRHGVLRRVRTHSTISAGGQIVTSDVDMDFFAFGIEPDVAVPDDSRTYDMTPMLEEQLESLGQPS